MIPKYQWAMLDPLRCLEVIWGDGHKLTTGEAGSAGRPEHPQLIHGRTGLERVDHAAAGVRHHHQVARPVEREVDRIERRAKAASEDAGVAVLGDGAAFLGGLEEDFQLREILAGGQRHQIDDGSSAGRCGRN